MAKPELCKVCLENEAMPKNNLCQRCSDALGARAYAKWGKSPKGQNKNWRPKETKK